MEKQIDVTCKVPDEDFDLITVEVALRWLEERLKADLRPIGWDDEQTAQRSAYRVLYALHCRYCDAIGRADEKRPCVL